MRNAAIFTIGYEGLSLQQFIARLKKFNVRYLVDVRENPLSRKKGFSKTSLKSILEAEDIQYAHFRALGSPFRLRYRLRQDGDYDSFFSAYSEHLLNNQEALVELYSYVINGTTCIMCFEKNPEKCHRSMVALKILKHYGNGLKIIHL